MKTFFDLFARIAFTMASTTAELSMTSFCGRPPGPRFA